MKKSVENLFFGLVLFITVPAVLLGLEVSIIDIKAFVLFQHSQNFWMAEAVEILMLAEYVLIALCFGYTINWLYNSCIKIDLEVKVIEKAMLKAFAS